MERTGRSSPIFYIGDKVVVTDGVLNCVFGVTDEMLSCIGDEVTISDMWWSSRECWAYHFYEDGGSYAWSEKCFSFLEPPDLPEFEASSEDAMISLFSQ